MQTRQDNLKNFTNWLDWRPNRITSDVSTVIIKHKCDELGFTNRDFQVKGKEIRFAEQSNLAFFKINLDKHV